MVDSVNFQRSLETTGRLKSGYLSLSEELRRQVAERDYKVWNVPKAFRPLFEFVYRCFQGLRRRSEVRKLKEGDYLILTPEARSLYVYPLGQPGGIVSLCAYRYHPITHQISMHSGIDISTERQNWPVLAVAPGRVSQAMYEDDLRNITTYYGNFVIIKHNGENYRLPISADPLPGHFTVDRLFQEQMLNEESAKLVRQSMQDNPDHRHYMRFSSLYAHLYSFSDEIANWISSRPAESSHRETGPYVQPGQYIGLSGTTGRSESEHLHLELIADVLRHSEDLTVPPEHVGKSYAINPGRLIVFQ